MEPKSPGPCASSPMIRIINYMFLVHLQALTATFSQVLSLRNHSTITRWCYCDLSNGINISRAVRIQSNCQNSDLCVFGVLTGTNGNISNKSVCRKVRQSGPSPKPASPARPARPARPTSQPGNQTCQRQPTPAMCIWCIYKY